MHRKHLVAAVAALALTGTTFAGSAVADEPAPAGKPTTHTLAKDLLSPLSLAVRPGGKVFYTQNFAGLLNVRGAEAPVFAAEVPGTEVAGVSVEGDSLRFTTTFVPEAPEGEEPEGEPAAALMTLTKKGKGRVLADTWGFEERKNPDGGVVYGTVGLEDDCEVPEDFAPYPGIVESHPYATAQDGGRTYIADAAANAILKYGKNGRLSTLAVLPPQGVEITEPLLEFGFPECALGATYNFEPVPTDVEVGRDGMLYVTTLPGGPEDPSLGARGSVYRVNPKTGKAKRVVSGLLAPTGLAVGKGGQLFVAELFGNRIARVKPGGDPSTLLEVVMPGDVEIRKNGDLYATTQVLPGEEEPPAGQVIRIKR